MNSFLSEFINNLENLRGKKILRITAVVWDDLVEKYHTSPSDVKRELFSLNAYMYCVDFENYGTIVFESMSGGTRSIGLMRLSEFPESNGAENDLFGPTPVTFIEANDQQYSESYFADFLETTVTKIETIQAHETGREGRRRNERGIRITNDLGKQLIIGWEVQHDPWASGVVAIGPDQLSKRPGLFTFTEV
jgi:hypothetical protein